MDSSSKELLQLEHKNSGSSSPLESTLLVCKRDSASQTKKKPSNVGNPITGPVAQSQVLGKVKNFLGVISEANDRLQQDAKDNSKNYDIEVLTGNESTVIEMDLMLGIADLHTPEAVTAAESAMAGGQPLIHLADSSSETESESNDDESDDQSNDDDTGNCDDVCKSCTSLKDKTSEFSKDDGSSECGRNNRSKKRPKIVEMP